MWSIADSKFIHGLERGDLYFLTIDNEGNLCLRLGRTHIPFPQLIEQVRRKAGDDASSFTLRLPQMIAHRIRLLQQKFKEVSERTGYSGKHQPLFPIKVNQQYECITTVLDADPTYGLEAGSKAEFILCRDSVGTDKSRLLMCNGGKDKEYLRLVKDAHIRGYRILLSIESIAEARLIVSQFANADIPLALRVKPYITASGHWSHSAGRDSKFGISAEDVPTVIKILRAAGLLESVVAIHAHAGSQLDDLRMIRSFVQFMVEMFAWLRDQGLTGLSAIDFGGGIPIDYKSIREQPAIDEYVTTLVESLVEYSKKLGLEKHPDIMTESGRAITAHSSLIVVDIVDVRNTSHSGRQVEEILGDTLSQWSQRIKSANSCEDFKQLQQALDQAFAEPTGKIPELISREALYSAVKSGVRERLCELGIASEICKDVLDWVTTPDTLVVGNFSLFNSAMDHVLVDQYFPVIPISGHNVQPATTVRLIDITCDSDGEISNFLRRSKNTGDHLFTSDKRPLTGKANVITHGIPLSHPDNILNSFMIIALTGAYQDVIEADHNLFGDLPDIVLTVENNGTVKLVYQRRAESISAILRDVGFQNGDTFDPYFNS
ncbi:MAG: hypothetical protein K9W43_12375 [Candidatus Thorarchaeota archaeon]|nr:hypothetical protein [Candidatus Thorarchaeota archaeon]